MCTGKCYVSAYKYKTITDQTTEFNWYVKRGCASSDNDPQKSGDVMTEDLFGVKTTNYVCDERNGTLCNGQLANYDIDLELKMQMVKTLQCYQCETPAGNQDPNHKCYNLPAASNPTACPDLTYTGCFETVSSFNSSDGTANYGMKRGCTKDAVGTTTIGVESFDNVDSKTTNCGKSGCNRNKGPVDNLVVAVSASSGAEADGADGGVTDTTTTEASSFPLFTVSLMFMMSMLM